MPAEFDEQIAVTESAPGEYVAELAPGWRVGGGLNGGYLLAVIGNAMRATLPGKPDPLALSAHFVSAGVPGPATIGTRVVRDGGRTATVHAELRQEGQPRISALATYGDLAALPDDVRTTADEPTLPPVDQCYSNDLAPAEIRAVAPLMDRFEMYFDPACVGWAVGDPSGTGLLQAWFRLAGARDPDPISLLAVVDSLPPVTFDLGQLGWAPTLQLSAHVRARPAPGWLKVRHHTRNVAGGMFEEDCEVWDSTGRLVAQSRQLALLPR
jgi:acyl-CoA thioesterase